MRTELDRLLEGHPVGIPARVPDAEEERFAALGYLGAAPLTSTAPTPMTPDEESAVAQMHRSAALLVAQKQYTAAIDRLRDITRAHPQIAVVQYQTGTLLQRSGRLAEAEKTFRAVAAIEPDSPYIQIALADVLLRSGRDQDASDRAALAMALAEHQDGPAQAAAHEVAAIVALAREQSEGALEHAEAAERRRSGNTDDECTSPAGSRTRKVSTKRRSLHSKRRHACSTRTNGSSRVCSGTWATPSRNSDRRRRRGEGLSRGASRVPRQIPRLLEPRDALSRDRPPGRRQGDARRARRRGPDT